MKILLGSLAALLLAQETKVELRWKLKEGQELRYRATRKVSLDFQGTEATRETSHTYRMTVAGVDDKGVATITMKYEAAAIKSMGLEAIDYDSEKDKNLPEEPSAKLEALLVGSSFTVRMDPVGRVVDVKGADAVLEALFKKAGGGADDEMIRELIKQMYSDEAMKGRLQQLSPSLPASKVGVGESWANDFTMKVPMVGALKFGLTHRLSEIKGSEAKIGQEIKIELLADDGSNPLAGQGQFKDLKGTGETVFALDRGVFLSTKAVVTLVMTAGGQSIPMKIEGRQTLLEK